MSLITKIIPFITEEIPAVYTEIDAMLLSQELGIPTLYGYSAVQPDGYQAPFSCQQMPQRIISYMQSEGIFDQGIYRESMGRVVPVGFEDFETEI